MEENEIKNDLDIINEYISIMKPLTFENKFALQFHNKPIRRIDEFVEKNIKDLAKHFKLHRKVRHAQAGIFITYNDSIPKTMSVDNEILQINLQYMNETVYRKRLIVLVVLLIIFIFVYKFIKETR